MKYKIPGVYLEPEPKRIEPIKLSKECLTGFIGIAEKGPINKGVRITSFYQFKKIFGDFTNYAYLSFSVYGFFLSGGKECIIIRTAHIDKKKQENSALKASIDIKDINEKLFLKIEALSEGTWGNLTKLKLWYDEFSSVSILTLANKGQNYIEVESIEDFTLDDIVCIKKIKTKEYKKIKKIENNRIIFHSKLNNTYNPDDEKISCENIKINLSLTNKNITEKYLYLSPNPKDEKYFIKEINSQSNLVKIIKIEDEYFLPEEIYYKNLNAGRNGILSLTPADFIGYFNGLDDNKGIGIFDSIGNISLIVAPDVLIFDELIHKDSDQAKNDIFIVQKAIIEHCEKWGNRFAILDIPQTNDIIKLMKWREKFDTKVAALYYPNIEMIMPEDITGLSSIFIPPSGHVAGVFAECDEKEGVFRAPANKFIKGAVGLDKNINDEEYEIIYPKGINCFKYIPGRGIKIWGARTLSSDISWRYINVRRTFSIIQEAIKDGAGWAVFEPNNYSLRKRIVRYVTAFLIDLWREGYLMGITAEQAFFVRCDDELNPTQEIEEGRINVEIGIAIARPAEFLVIRIKANSENSMVLLDNE